MLRTKAKTHCTKMCSCLMWLIVFGLEQFFVVQEYQLFSDGKLNSLDDSVLSIF